MSTGWLKNDRMTLRSPEPEDLELLYHMENDTHLWSVGCNTLPYSRHTLRTYLIETRQDLYSERQARFVIEMSNGESAGMIDLANFDPHNSRAEVCIGILDEFRRKGIAKEALQLLCAYALDFLQLHQLYAYIPCDNSDSIQLFTNAGFKPTAKLKEWLHRLGEYTDVHIMQLINTRYQHAHCSTESPKKSKKTSCTIKNSQKREIY